MGKKGDALRAAKMQKTVYQFTREQLFQHDKQVAKDALEKYHSHVEHEIGDFFCEESNKNIERTFRFILAMSCKILIEEFKWPKLPEGRKEHPHSRVVRFANGVAKEINECNVGNPEDVDNYCEEVHRKYGIKFEWQE